MNWLEIDGSQGEGGGQVLRSALSLSLATGRPFRITGVRAGRAKPGLLRQHLTGVGAAQQLCGAIVEGDELGSQSLSFAPGALRPGRYHFSVGTAGSTTLVLQAILPALLVANGPSHITVEGGTHNPGAPCYEFFARALIPLLERMGPTLRPTLERMGFHPAGGGRIAVEIEPVAKLAEVVVLERGELRAKRARACVANLVRRIAEKEMAVMARDLELAEHECVIDEVSDVEGPGNVVIIELESDAATEVVTGFGRLGVPSARVAQGAVNEARRFLEAGVPIGAHLADQLMVPMALAGGGRFRTVAPSKHTYTVAAIVESFLGVSTEFIQESEHAWQVVVHSEQTSREGVQR